MPIGTKTTDYQDRPLIIVATPQKIQELALTQLASAYVNGTLSTLGIPFGWLFTLIKNMGAIQGLVTSSSDERRLEILEKVLDLKYKIYWYEPSDAIRFFNFDVGYTPKDGEILFRHPVEQNRYIIPINYSRLISREKEAAFMKIAASLGAKEIRLISAETNEKKGFFDSSLPLQEAAGQIGIRANFNQDGSLIKSVYSRFGQPDYSPYVPSDLQCWVNLDPDLGTIVHGRLKANLEYHQVKLNFSESMGIGGEIAAKIAGQGLSFGGKYKRVFQSTWHYEVEYWPKKS